MKYRIILIIIILLVQNDSFGQETSKGKYTPFSLLIIMPDSISLHESLTPFIDSVELDFRETYYSQLKQMEFMVDLYPEERKHAIKLKIQRAKLAEMDVLNTKYLDLVPMLTCSELWDLFDNNYEYSFDYISREELFSYDLERVANYYEVDYVLSYKQITTPIENGEPILKIETELFSKRDARVVHQSASYGYARFYKNNSGVLQACTNDLQCMLESVVMSSSADLFRFLKGKQKID